MITGRDYERFINELIEVIINQEKEIRKLEDTISRVKQYIEVYEDYIKGE